MDTNMQEGIVQNSMTLGEKLHLFRKEIDACIERALYFKGGRPNEEQDPHQSECRKAGREMALAYTKLQEAKMWVGKCLEVLEGPLPPQYQDKAK